MTRRVSVCFLSLVSVLVLFASNGWAFEIEIDVSPNVLNIASKGKVVTVHTDIGYSDVEVSSIYMNGIYIQSYKADDRGFFVAKFSMDEIKKLPLDIDEYNTLTLVGLTKDGESFWGEQEIKVVNNGSK